MPDNRQGTGYINLQRFIQANKNNQLGTALTQGIGNSADKTSSSLNDAKNQFDTGLNDESNRLNSGTTNAQGILSDVSTNPDKVTDDRIQQYKDFTGDAYKGPNGLQNEDAIRANANDTREVGSLAGNAEGRQELLRRFVGGPNYTANKQRLDQLFIGADANKDIQGARQKALQSISSVGLDLNSGKQRAENETQTFKDKQAGVIGNVLQKEKDVSQGLQDKATQTNQDIASRYNAAVDKLKSGYDPGYGINGTTTFNVDPTRFVSRIGDVNASQVATPEDNARYQALLKLTQQPDTVGIDAKSLNSYDPTKAISFDKTGFNTEVAGNQTKFQQALAQSGIDYINNPQGFNKSTVDQNLANLSYGQTPTKDSIPVAQKNIVEAMRKNQEMLDTGNYPPQWSRELVVNYNNMLQNELTRVNAALEQVKNQYGANTVIQGEKTSSDPGFIQKK